MGAAALTAGHPAPGVRLPKAGTPAAAAHAPEAGVRLHLP